MSTLISTSQEKLNAPKSLPHKVNKSVSTDNETKMQKRPKALDSRGDFGHTSNSIILISVLETVLSNDRANDRVMIELYVKNCQLLAALMNFESLNS